MYLPSYQILNPAPASGVAQRGNRCALDRLPDGRLNGRFVPGLLVFVLLCLPAFSRLKAEDLHAEKLYAWEFQRSEDRNADQWPDGWRRRAGRDFPGYIPVRITARNPEMARAARDVEPLLSRLWMQYQTGRFFKGFIPETTPEPIARAIDQYLVNNCLLIDMDGGSVQLESPAFPLDSRFTYTLDASLATEKLAGHEVWMEMLLLDQKARPIHSVRSPSSQGTTDWHHVTTGTFSSEEMRMGQIVVHVQPLKSRQLGGQIRIDEIRLYRMPKLELTMNMPFHVAMPGQQVDITCTALGIADARSSVSFKLIDHMGRQCQQTQAVLAPADPIPASLADTEATKDVATDKRRVQLITVPPPVKPAEKAAEKPPERNGGAPSGKPVAIGPGLSTQASLDGQSKGRSRMDGIAHWHLRVAEPGYYRIVVDLGRTIQNSQTRVISREISLAIVDESRVGVGGPFGWSLPDFGPQFTPEIVPEMVKLGGVGWLKIPVWFDRRDVKTADRLSVLLERLDLRKVNCVGLLDRPMDMSGQVKPPQPVAVVFGTPADWEPELEPALTRMSMKLSWFQLGRDSDRSFIGNPNLVPLVTDIRNRMQAYSQELQLALAWDYQDPVPGGKNLPWQASQMSCEPQLTAKELRSFLSSPGFADHTRWVTLNPISAQRYGTLDRVRDLAERMIAVKEHKVKAAFITMPLDREFGIFNPDGSAAELFLPWRVLNQHLAGATYIGSINMPGGSTNHVFSEGSTGFMILWNDRAAVEQLYLGDEVKAIDLWGRPIAMEQTHSERQAPEQRLNVTSWPILVQGINVPVAQWRIAFQMENRRLPSTLAARANVPIVVTNTLGASAYGVVSLHAPSLLQPGAQGVRMQVGDGAQQHVELPVPLRNDASAGKHTLRFDFQLTANRELTFSVYDAITLGIGDVEMVWETLELEKDRALLRVELVNANSRPVSFDCKLFPPQKPYRRFQILNAPPGSTQRDLLLPLEDVPAGSVVWIRCEEIGTGRVLNYRLPLKVGE